MSDISLKFSTALIILILGSYLYKISDDLYETYEYLIYEKVYSDSDVEGKKITIFSPALLVEWS